MSESDSNEMAYMQGERRAYLSILGAVLSGMLSGAAQPEDKPLLDALALHNERLEAISALRELCSEFGDNDWEDDLHLADVIRKHLAPYLEEFGGD